MASCLPPLLPNTHLDLPTTLLPLIIRISMTHFERRLITIYSHPLYEAIQVVDPTYAPKIYTTSHPTLPHRARDRWQRLCVDGAPALVPHGVTSRIIAITMCYLIPSWLQCHPFRILKGVGREIPTLACLDKSPSPYRELTRRRVTPNCGARTPASEL